MRSAVKLPKPLQIIDASLSKDINSLNARNSKTDENLMWDLIKETLKEALNKDENKNALNLLNVYLHDINIDTHQRLIDRLYEKMKT